MQTVKIFAGIARKYDIMNRIMSLGLDLSWRRRALRAIKLPVAARILDLACGTGDFTLELAKRWPDADITGVDITPEMIEIAKPKFANARNVAFSVGNAQELSDAETGSYDLVVCAFGFRNFPDKVKALPNADGCLHTAVNLLCWNFSALDRNFLALP
jgi:demethylmenaquinone methyltransferase/2-methoxy-6-polyprenyl-1,4-benzoquinol methylase